MSGTLVTSSERSPERSRTRSGRQFKRKVSSSPPSRKMKRVPKIKAMVLTINSHGSIDVELRDIKKELELFKDIVSASDDEDNYTINETFTIMDNEDPPVEKIGGSIDYIKDQKEYSPYMWIANVIPIPENIKFYGVNVPCAVGYETPDRCLWSNVCSETGFIEWENQLTLHNLKSEMCRVSDNYKHGFQDQILDLVENLDIHPHSIRQNICFTPIKKVLQKFLETQESDNLQIIKVHIFTEDGKTTYTLLDIFNEYIEPGSFSDLKKQYPQCSRQINKYIKKIQHDITIEDDVNLLSVTLNDILQVLFSLVDKYGDDTDIYMIDHSCFNLGPSNSLEGQVKKDIYSKLTQHFTNRTAQIYMGGSKESKRRKRRKRHSRI